MPMQIPLRLADIPLAARRLHLPSRRPQRAGRRIPAAAGLPRVYNLAGGIDAWSTHVDPAVPRY
jgi:hypothetical protein